MAPCPQEYIILILVHSRSQLWLWTALEPLIVTSLTSTSPYALVPLLNHLREPQLSDLHLARLNNLSLHGTLSTGTASHVSQMESLQSGLLLTLQKKAAVELTCHTSLMCACRRVISKVGVDRDIIATTFHITALILCNSM